MEAIEYYTYSDYKYWDGEWELIDGVPMAMSPAPMIRHQVLAYRVAMELDRSIEDKCDRCLVFGEADYKVDEVTLLKPDVVLLCDEPNLNHITKAPEIVVEVISPSTARRDEKVKYEIYESEKVAYFVLVYPDDDRAKIYKLAEDGKYSKEGDFSVDSYRFEETLCKAVIDWKRVFR